MTHFFRELPSRQWRVCLLYLALTLLLLLPATGLIPLMDRDEPRFAQATREMQKSDQWVIPYFNGEYRFDKPPLTYWWMRLHYQISSPTELAARLHSILATWLSAFFIYRLGRFLFSPAAGFLAGLGFMTCFQVLIHGRLCVADLPMVLTVIVIMDACARLLFAESAPRRFGPAYWQLVAGLAGGFLAKGPVAWGIPLLALLLMRWPLARASVPWRRLQAPSALIIATALVAIWGLSALWQTDGAYWRVGIGEHVVHRGMAALNGRVNIPGIYYFGTALISLLPWSPFAGAALFQGAPMKGDPRRAFLTGWFVAPFLIFAFYATQLPHYIMPGFAAFFLLLFREGHLPNLTRRLSRIAAGLGLGIAVLISALIVAVAVIPWPEPITRLAPSLRSVAGIMILLSVVLPFTLVFAKRSLTRWLTTCVTFAGAACLLAVVAGNLRTHHPVLQIRERLNPESTPDALYAACGFTEPSLVFYLDSALPWRLEGSISELPNILAETPPRSAVVALSREWQLGKIASQWWMSEAIIPNRDERAKLDSAINPAKFQTETISGYNIARSTWVELVLIRPL
jgi:4-amino-4-deoxy-L-arabinose transferase-like glycosyltransferase